MRIISVNTNGIRAAARKGFFDWLEKQQADVVCIQETKAQEHQLTDEVFFLPGVDRRTVTSLWTPNTLYFEITEEGMEADLVICWWILTGFVISLSAISGFRYRQGRWKSIRVIEMTASSNERP